MQIRAYKSTCLGRDGADEMYEVIPSDPHSSFVKDRARYVLDALPVHLPSPQTKTYTESEVMAFFSTTTKHMSFERLFEATIATFGANARNTVDNFLRQTVFKADPPPLKEGKPYLRLYPSTPQGYWWVDTSGSIDKIVRSYVTDLQEWAQKYDPEGEEIEFKDNSLRDFRETYPQFARRYDRRLPDNGQFPPAVRFMELGAVPYSKPHAQPASGSRFDMMRWMQLFSKNIIRVLSITGSPTGGNSASSRRIMRMIACAAYFVNELTALLKMHSIDELSRAVFGTLRGYGKDGEYPPPAYIDWVPIALMKQPLNPEYGGWDADRKRHFRMAEACFFSYCRDFALGNLFTRNAMRSSVFRVDYIDKCIGGAFIRHHRGAVEIMHDEFWSNLKIDAKTRADHVTVSEAVSVYTPPFDGKVLTGNKKLVSVLADLLESQVLPEGLLVSYITDVLRQLLLGTEMPLGWIRSHRINYFIMQRWKENLYSKRAEGIHEMAATIARRVQDYITEFDGTAYEVFKQIPYADLYYTLNAASITDYPRQAFGPTLIQEHALPLLMLDPCTQMAGSRYDSRLSVADDEENFWMLCGGESLKPHIRVCEVRNRLYMQPGSNVYADSARLANSLDWSSLMMPPGDRPKIGAPKSLFDAMIGLNLEKDSRTLENALSVSARRVVKGVDYDLLQAFAISVRVETDTTHGVVQDALYQLLTYSAAPERSEDRKRPRLDYSGEADCQFNDSLDDLYRSIVPFSVVPLGGLVESEAILEQTSAQRDALFKANSLDEFAAAVKLTPTECRVAFLVRNLVDNDMLGLKVLYSSLKITGKDYETYIEALGVLHTLAAELIKKKVSPAKINAILTDAADFIARKSDLTGHARLPMRIATDPTRRFIVAIPPPLLTLLQKIDPDYLVAINLVPVSAIRPHDRYLHSMAGASTTLTFLDDRGRLVHAGGGGAEMPLFLILSHPGIPLPFFEHSEKLQQVLFPEQGINGPSDRELDIIEIVDAREIRMEEQLELRVALVNDCFGSAKDGLTPAAMRLLERVYHKVCYLNGFSTIQPTVEADDDPEAKRQRVLSSERKKERHPRLMIDVGEVNTVEEAIDRLMVGIEKLSGLNLQHARVSFCFVALPTFDVNSALYAVVSPLSTAPQRVQSSHVMALICGRNVYLTSTKPSK